jgi:hypothetical protein
MEEATNQLSTMTTRNNASRLWQINRLKKQRVPPRVSGTKLTEIAALVANKGTIDITSKKVARDFLQTIRTLDAHQIDLSYLMPRMRECMSRYYVQRNDDLSSDLRLAACHIDAMCFRTVPETKESCSPLRDRDQARLSCEMSSGAKASGAGQ